MPTVAWSIRYSEVARRKRDQVRAARDAEGARDLGALDAQDHHAQADQHEGEQRADAEVSSPRMPIGSMPPAIAHDDAGDDRS